MANKIPDIPDETIELVHGVVDEIEKAKGYTSKVSKGSVQLVLQAITLINIVVNSKRQQDKSMAKMKVTTPEIAELLEIANLPVMLAPCEECDNG